MTGKLYIVATPIGNLEDITLRAVRVLSEADIILAEDTRVSRKLLNAIIAVSGKLLDLNKLPREQKLISYHQHSGEEKKLEILNFLQQGKNIALITDAGTPGISDPGGELVEYLLSYIPDLEIVPIPGASAVTCALSVSGFKADKFLFLGYWPKKKVSRVVKLIKSIDTTIVYLDSPHRVVRNLETIEKVLGGWRRTVVAREMTKLHETIYRGTLTEVLNRLRDEKKIKGELVVVVEGER